MMNQYKIESRHEFIGQNIVKSEIGCITEGSNSIKTGQGYFSELPIVKELMDKN